MSILINPYIAGNPVGGTKSFFGRQDVFKRILSLLQNPNENALTLYGQRRIGKTSILKELERQLPEEGSYFPIYFDLQDKANWTLNQVLYDLARTISLKLGLDTPDKTRFEDNGYDYYGKEFLVQILNSLDENQAIVLLFDEFDVLDNPNPDRAGVTFFPYLRELMGKHFSAQKFIFVIGRKPEDLSTIVLSIFKGVPSQRISLLQKKDAESIIRLSEEEGNQTLLWNDSAVERVWQLTHGHPYITQLLCRVTWDRVHDEDHVSTPVAGIEHVDASIEDALREGTNAFAWIWEGLPPAERFVIAALSQSDDKPVSRDEIDSILQQSGVRIIISEFMSAPETLVSWDLLEKLSNDIFQFRVPLFRLWAQQNKPLIVVKEEIDRLDPQAEDLYRAAKRYYDQGQYPDALETLNRALRSNPNHLKAKLLQGQTWLDEEKIPEAVKVLKDAYDYDRLASRPLLTQALLAQAEAALDEDAVSILNEILEIDPNQLAARKALLSIWNRAAEAHLTRGEFDQAAKAYEQADNPEGVQQARQQAQKSRLLAKEHLAQQHEQNELWLDAAKVYQELLTDFPDEGSWQGALEHANQQGELHQLYLQAVGALESGDKQRADQLLTRILRIQKDYRDTPRLLMLATQGLDVDRMVTIPARISKSTFWRGLIGIGLVTVIVLVFLVVLLLRSAAEREALSQTSTAASDLIAIAATLQAEQQNEFLADITEAAILTSTQQAALIAEANETNAPTLTRVAILNTENAELNLTLVAVLITPTPSNTPTSLPTPTFTMTSTITPTWIPTFTETSTPTPTSTFTETSTPTPTPTFTPTETPTNTINSSPIFVVNPDSGIETVNLRAGPGTEYASIGTADDGDVLDITGRNSTSTWYQVRTSSSGRAWIAATVGSIQGNRSNIPIVSSIAPTQPVATSTSGQTSTSDNHPFISNVVQDGQSCDGFDWIVYWSDPNGDADRIEFLQQGTGNQGNALFDADITGNRREGTTRRSVICNHPECSADIVVVDRAGNRSNIWVAEVTCPSE